MGIKIGSSGNKNVIDGYVGINGINKILIKVLVGKDGVNKIVWTKSSGVIGIPEVEVIFNE